MAGELMGRGYSEPRTLMAGTIFVCPACNQPARIQKELSEDELPRILSCPNCSNDELWDKFPILPKVRPVEGLKFWTLKTSIVDDGNYGEVAAQRKVDLEREFGIPKDYDSGIANPEDEINSSTAPPFWALARDLQLLTRRSVAKLQQIHNELDAFKRVVLDFFYNEWKYAKRFQKGWNKGYIQEFIDFPYITIPVQCEDALAASYARWVIAPKFFEPGLGFKVYNNGGFRLELMNQYSRSLFPVESHIIKRLGLPSDYDLRVLGNKLLGSAVQLCWQDIPGLVEDADSSAQWRSVFIARSQLAREWLVQHGIKPWSAAPLKENELHEVELSEDIKDTALFRRAWKDFSRYGRLGIYWNNQLHARKFATIAGLMVKGVTAVFTATHKERMAWDSLYSIWHNKTVNHANEFCFFLNGDSVRWDAVMKTKMVIVDLYGELDMEILQRLFNYSGRVLVLCDNPLLDFATTNAEAPTVHALAGYANFEPANWERWPTTRLLEAPDLKAALDHLNKEKFI